MSGWRQLWFGYAASGLEGSDREQVVAFTPGLLDDPVIERQLRRLCRYDVDESEGAPRFGAQSFGWVDDGDLRYVFCRTPVPNEDGTAVTAAAHLLVGPRLATTAPEILQLFDSPTWWRGELLEPASHASRGALPEISFHEFEPAISRSLLERAVHDEQLARIAEALLANAGSHAVVLPETPRQAVASMVALAKVTPSLVDLVSFSSHEVGPAQMWFDVVGCASAQERPHMRTVQRALERQGGPRLGGDGLPDVEAMVSAVAPFVVGADGKLNLPHRELFLRAIDALIRRDPEGTAWLVGDPRSQLLLVSSATGRAVAAESLWEPVPPRWVEGSPSLDRWGQELAQLGVMTWQLRPPEATRRAIADAWTQLSRLGRAAGDGFVAAFIDEALNHDLREAALPGRLLAAALRGALDARFAPASMNRLVGLAAHHVDADLLTSPVVPVTWRVRLAVAALDMGALSREVLGETGVRDPQLAQHLIAEDIDDDSVGAILATVPPEHAAALVAAGIHTLGSKRAMRALREVGRALGSARALTVVDALNSVVDLRLDRDDEEWVAGHFARAVSAGAHDSRRPDPVMDLPWALAKALNTSGTDGWRQTGFLMRPHGNDGRDTLVELFEALLQQVDDQRQHHAIATLGVDTCLLSAYTADRVAQIVEVLGTQQGLDQAELTSLLLTRAERMVSQVGHSAIGPILVHLCRSSVRRAGLRRAVLAGGHQPRAEALGARLSENQWREVLQHAYRQGSTCAIWLRGLRAAG
jgi:hypothetical protein